MKLFKFTDYTKPGKGIDPNEKPKPAFIRYWIILWNKRYKLIATNWMYLLLNFISPVIAAGAFYIAFALYTTMSGISVTEVFENEMQKDIFFWSISFVTIYFTSIPLFAVGPSYAGCAFLFKSFANWEPVFLWSDYVTKMKTNLKLSIKVMLTNAIAAFILMVDIAVYLAITDNKTGAFPEIPFIVTFLIAAVILFALAMLLMVSMYIYPIMVTFNISYRQLYKDAMILSIARWLPNIGMLLLEAVIILAPIVLIDGWFAYILPIVLYLFITPAFFGFTNTFYVWPTIKKYMIDNPNADKSDKDDTPPAPPAEKEPEEVKPRGRFENGRWIDE